MYLPEDVLEAGAFAAAPCGEPHERADGAESVADASVAREGVLGRDHLMATEVSQDIRRDREVRDVEVRALVIHYTPEFGSGFRKRYND